MPEQIIRKFHAIEVLHLSSEKTQERAVRKEEISIQSHHDKKPLDLGLRPYLKSPMLR